MALLKGPYMKGQKPSPCGCYYPDVVRLYDEGIRRQLYCTNHGLYSIQIERGSGSKESCTPEQALQYRWIELCRLIG